MAISLIAKVSIAVGTAAVTGVAGYFGATKTETGKKAVAAVAANETVGKAVKYTTEKVNAVKSAVEAHKEAAAITNFLKGNDELRTALFAQINAGKATK